VCGPPRVLVCDEITSALDADLASAVVDLLLRLCADLRLAMLLIRGLMRASRFETTAAPHRS
jgi:ABC-type methionine transport system ATPase subunit